jgi:hypothetical protein
MPTSRLALSIAIGTAGLVVGLAVPAAAHEAAVVAHTINGSSIKPNTITGKQVKESTLGTVPRAAALTPLVWHQLVLVHGWKNVAGDPAGYAIDSQGLVHLRGQIHLGATFSSAFSLPPSARPKVTFGVPVMSGALLINDLDIESSGPVTPTTAQDNLNTTPAELMTLDGVTYSPTQ